MKEKLQEYALIAEIISAIAVVISLAFVGMQVRMGAEETASNTAAIRGSAFQDLQTQIAQFQILVIENSDFRSAFEIFGRNQEFVSTDQQAMIDAWLRLIFRHGETVYMRYDAGLITETELVSAIAPVIGNMGPPYARDFWIRFSNILNPDYVVYMNKQLNTVY